MHINDKDFEKFQNNTMDTSDMIAFLEHLDNCDYCMEQLMQEEAGSPVTAPSYLKEQILDRTSSLEIKAEKTAADTSYKMRLFYEGLHTAAGVIMALLLLFSIGQTDFFARDSRIEPISQERHMPSSPERQTRILDFSRGIGQGLSESSNKIGTYLNDISNKLVNGGN